jgi:site-specific recombinase XerD
VTGALAVPATKPDVPGEPPDRVAQLVRTWVITKRSPWTRFAYAHDLGIAWDRPGARHPSASQEPAVPPWLAFCAAAGVDPLAAQEHHVAVWARLMESEGLAPATRARKLSAVSSWYSWLVRQHVIAANPAAELDRPLVDADTSTTPGLTKEQALALMTAADISVTRQAVRNAALTATLLFTGARVSEAIGASVADLGMDRGHRVLWVTRKGGLREALALVPPAASRIDAYLATRPDAAPLPARPGQTGRPPPLFATSTGRPVLPADVWGMIRSLARAAGLPPELVQRMCPHAMRHSYATLSLDAGVSLRDLQDAMGHKDPRTTRRYDRSRGKLDRAPGYLLAAYLAAEDG